MSSSCSVVMSRSKTGHGLIIHMWTLQMAQWGAIGQLAMAQGAEAARKGSIKSIMIDIEYCLLRNGIALKLLLMKG